MYIPFFAISCSISFWSSLMHTISWKFGHAKITASKLSMQMRKNDYSQTLRLIGWHMYTSRTKQVKIENELISCKANCKNALYMKCLKYVGYDMYWVLFHLPICSCGSFVIWSVMLVHVYLLLWNIEFFKTKISFLQCNWKYAIE